MAAQYDVNLEKCALLKCLCGSAFAAGSGGAREGLAGASAPQERPKHPHSTPKYFFSGSNFIQPIL